MKLFNKTIITEYKLVFSKMQNIYKCFLNVSIISYKTLLNLNSFILLRP